MEKSIGDHIAILMSADITSAAIQAQRISVLAAMTLFGVNPRQKQKTRHAGIIYRGGASQTPVTTYYDQYLMAESAAIEGAAVAKKVGRPQSTSKWDYTLALR